MCVCHEQIDSPTIRVGFGKKDDDVCRSSDGQRACALVTIIATVSAAPLSRGVGSVDCAGRVWSVRPLGAPICSLYSRRACVENNDDIYATGKRRSRADRIEMPPECGGGGAN